MWRWFFDIFCWKSSPYHERSSTLRPGRPSQCVKSTLLEKKKTCWAGFLFKLLALQRCFHDTHTPHFLTVYWGWMWSSVVPSSFCQEVGLRHKTAWGLSRDRNYRKPERTKFISKNKLCFQCANRADNFYQESWSLKAKSATFRFIDEPQKTWPMPKGLLC